MVYSHLMPAKKPTRWMSSSPHMLQRLSRRCTGNHEHQQLVGGRAKAAEDYSLDLISEILRGMRDTSDHEEPWDGDCPEPDMINAMHAAGKLHDVKAIGISAAYQAKDAEVATENLSVKLKYHDGRIEDTKLVF